MAELKLAAAKDGITRVEVKERKLMLTRRANLYLSKANSPV
jgi:hypothetical protein